MKFDEFKADLLKKMLSKLELSTAGNKVDLLQRLTEQFKLSSLDFDTHEFEDTEDLQSSIKATTSIMNLNSMFAIRMQKVKENSKKMGEKFTETSAELKEARLNK